MGLLSYEGAYPKIKIVLSGRVVAEGYSPASFKCVIGTTNQWYVWTSGRHTIKPYLAKGSGGSDCSGAKQAYKNALSTYKNALRSYNNTESVTALSSAGYSRERNQGLAFLGNMAAQGEKDAAMERLEVAKQELSTAKYRYEVCD